MFFLTSILIQPEALPISNTWMNGTHENGIEERTLCLPLPAPAPPLDSNGGGIDPFRPCARASGPEPCCQLQINGASTQESGTEELEKTTTQTC